MTKPREDKSMKAFGKRVAELRKDSNLTQEQLASNTSLAVRTIASIEQGRRWARLNTLQVLAKGLDVSLSELFKGL